MSKFYKIAGIIAGVAAGIGLVLCIIGVALGAKGYIAFTRNNGFEIIEGRDQWEYSNMDMEEFSSIHIESNVAKVNIVPSNDGKYGAKCVLAGDESSIRFEVKDGKLSIVDSGDMIRFSLDIFSWFDSVDNSITIYVPKSVTLDGIYISSDVGEVCVEDITGAKNFEIGTDVGDLEITGGSYDYVNIAASVGDVNIDNITVNNTFSLYSDVGDVEVEGSFDCQVGIETNVGDIDVDTTQSEVTYAYSVSTQAGDIDFYGREIDGTGTLTGGTGEKSMIIKTKLGDIEVK